MAKIGIMGGTFNPIHNAHLLIASFAKDEYNLDKVLFITSGNPPHKTDIQILNPKIRHEMTKLAIENNKDFVPCDYEVNREEYSYTSHTLTYLKTVYPDDELYFIVGGDSLQHFKTWYEPDVIARLCTILVFARGGYSADTIEEIDIVRNLFDADIRLIHSPTFSVSSSMIRERLMCGKSVKYLVPDNVIEYISKNNLYKGDL